MLRIICFILAFVALIEIRSINGPATGGAPEPQRKNQFGIPQAKQPAKPRPLLAGVAKVEITNKTVIPVNDPLYVKALVLKNGAATAVIITVDAVAIGEIGYIGNDFLGKVRDGIHKELGIAPENVM